MSASPVPSADVDLVPWSLNWALKFPLHGASAGFSAAEIARSLDDANSIAFALGSYYPFVTSVGAAGTAWKNGVKSGDGSLPLTPMPTMPALPPIPPSTTFRFGARDRLVADAARVKKAPLVSDTMIADLGITTPAAGAQPTKPLFTATALSGGLVRLDWQKGGWTGVRGMMRRKGDATWIELGLDLVSPLLDKTPLLNPNQPEVREYQMQYIDGDEPTGQLSDIVSATVT